MSFFKPLKNIANLRRDKKYFETGMKLMDEEKFHKATYEFIEAIKIKPEVEKYHDAYGKSLYKRGLFSEADTAFTIADDLELLNRNPSDVKILCRLAKSFQNKRMLSVSKKYIGRAMAIDRRGDQVHYLMGRVERDNYAGNK